MNKTTCRKLQVWTKKDTVFSVLLYLLNVVILFGIFVLGVLVNSIGGEPNDFVNYFVSDFTKPLIFAISLLAICGFMGVYFYFYDRDFLKRKSNSVMIFTIFEISLILAFVASRFLSVFIVPFALPVLLTMFLTNKKKAFFINVAFCVLLFLFDFFSFRHEGISGVTLLAGFLSGTIAIFAMGKVYSRIALFLRSLIISIPMIAIVSLLVINNYTDKFVVDIICASVSGVAQTLIFVMILPIMEAIFKKLSCFRLAEMTNHNNRLIKRLIAEAPGTFHHSISVSNMAEACALAIGEDALFTRVCAYYHDIGKIRRPELFTENQRSGRNPHDDLTPELSANIIRSHAQDGYDLLIKNSFPKEIADVCVQHHGTLPILFFYEKAKKFTDGELDINKFRYSGPKPQTKTAAIIMIVDGCEAIARTLQDRSYDNIHKQITKIIGIRYDDGQFDECDITSNDLSIISDVLTASLTDVYHDRILYPDQVEELKAKAKKERAKTKARKRTSNEK